MTNKNQVLIVEDNVIMSENFDRLLKNEFNVSIARSAEEAMDKINQKIPDFMVVDVLLTGHSIFALLNELQSYPDTAEILTVICSDLADELDPEVLDRYNIRKVLNKSQMRPIDLVNNLRRLKHEAKENFSHNFETN